MAHSKPNSFLGQGWGFPPTFNKERSTVELVADEHDISESLFLLLSTTPGERTHLPRYGCNLRKLVYEKLDAALEARIKDVVEHAILHFEPRVKLNSVKILDTKKLDGIIQIEIVYTIKATNSRSNMVYPFYIVEGTDIRFR